MSEPNPPAQPSNDPYAPPAADPYAAPAGAPYANEQPQYAPQAAQSQYGQTPNSQPQYGTPAPAQKSPILSILSLIGGILGVILGFFGWGFLFSLAGVILGHLGMKREPNGRGMALAGLITGYIGVAINVIVIGIFIFITVLAFGTAASYSTY